MLLLKPLSNQGRRCSVYHYLLRDAVTGSETAHGGARILAQACLMERWERLVWEGLELHAKGEGLSVTSLLPQQVGWGTYLLVSGLSHRFLGLA